MRMVRAFLAIGYESNRLAGIRADKWVFSYTIVLDEELQVLYRFKLIGLENGWLRQ